MAGKAIRAMGKAVLLGAEHLIILRRMSVMKAATPSSDTNSEKSRNFEAMFNDALELSRHISFAVLAFLRSSHFPK